MNAEPALLGPLLKAQRAKTQIQELNVALRAFLKSTSHKIVSEVYPETDEEIWRFELSKKPSHELSILTGEILHNLRSALDNMLSEIVVRISKKTDSKVEFPFGRNFDEFEAKLLKQ